MILHNYKSNSGKDLIIYIVADENNVYLLHACRKQKNKTEKKDSEIVKKRAKELGMLLNKKFI